MRRDKRTGHARVRINGKTYWLGRWGSPEARDKFDTLMAAFIASGRRSVDAALSMAAPPPCPVPSGSSTGRTVPAGPAVPGSCPTVR